MEFIIYSGINIICCYLAASLTELNFNITTWTKFQIGLFTGALGTHIGRDLIKLVF